MKNYIYQIVVLAMMLGWSLASAQDNAPLQQMQSGLYAAEALDNQGLIVERQGDAVAAYPLLYDEEGDSRWFFSGAFYEEGLYEADLYALSDGQCLGCPAPMAPPELEIVGNILIVVQDPANLLVSINGGEFIEYTSLEYGYETYEVAVGDPVPDLTGTWAMVNPPWPEIGEGPAYKPSGDIGRVFRLEFEGWENPAEFFPAPVTNLEYTAIVSSGHSAKFNCGRASTDRANLTGYAYCLIDPARAGPILGIPGTYYADIISANAMVLTYRDEQQPEDNPAPSSEPNIVVIRIK